jgi:hypothetical protein
MSRIVSLASVLLVAALATPSPAVCQLPESEVPGSSPVGKMQQMDRRRTPSDPQRQPTAMTPDPNYPKPEPVAPPKSPDDAPNLPGSGRKDVVPGS